MVAILVAIIVVGAALAPTQHVSFPSSAKYDSAKGFNIKYPSGWSIQEPQNSTVAVIFSPTTDTASANVKVQALSLSLQPKLGELIDGMTRELKKAPQYTQLEASNTSLAGSQAYRVVYTVVADNQPLKALQLWTLKGGSFYMVTYTATLDNFEKHVGTAQQMIDSFGVKAGAVPPSSSIWQTASPSASAKTPTRINETKTTSTAKATSSAKAVASSAPKKVSPSPKPVASLAPSATTKSTPTPIPTKAAADYSSYFEGIYKKAGNAITEPFTKGTNQLGNTVYSGTVQDLKQLPRVSIWRCNIVLAKDENEAHQRFHELVSERSNAGYSPRPDLMQNQQGYKEAWMGVNDREEGTFTYYGHNPSINSWLLVIEEYKPSTSTALLPNAPSDADISGLLTLYYESIGYSMIVPFEKHINVFGNPIYFATGVLAGQTTQFGIEQVGSPLEASARFNEMVNVIMSYGFEKILSTSTLWIGANSNTGEGATIGFSEDYDFVIAVISK